MKILLLSMIIGFPSLLAEASGCLASTIHPNPDSLDRKSPVLLVELNDLKANMPVTIQYGGKGYLKTSERPLYIAADGQLLLEFPFSYKAKSYHLTVLTDNNLNGKVDQGDQSFVYQDGSFVSFDDREASLVYQSDWEIDSARTLIIRHHQITQEDFLPVVPFTFSTTPASGNYWQCLFFNVKFEGFASGFAKLYSLDLNRLGSTCNISSDSQSCFVPQVETLNAACFSSNQEIDNLSKSQLYHYYQNIAPSDPLSVTLPALEGEAN